MAEWWSYTLSDFLLFSPRTYYRMLERHNEALWPAQLITLGLGLGMLAMLRRPAPRQGRILFGILAALWLFVAWAFLWQRYATINWAAVYVVPLFVLEAALLVWVGVIPTGVAFRLRRDARGGLGIALFIVSLYYPLIAPLAGRPWQQAEVFGITPDPTAVGTLGLLLLAEGRLRWELMPVPILWGLISAATLLAMTTV